MTSIRHALAFSMIERYAVIALGLVSYVLIARLLTPEEIGIYSVTAALVGVAQVIREFGIGSYLIQAEKLHQSELDTALGLALAAGATMFGIGVLAAPWAAAFYRDPRIASILMIVSLNFLILPFCSIGQSLLRREMRFKPLMFSNMWAGLAGFVVTIGLALASFGPASLAWGAVATNLVTAVGSWLALSGSTRPRRLAFGEWRPIASYGRQTTVAAVVTSAASDMNDLAVGRILGFAPVAILNRAMGMMHLFHRDLLGPARSVAFPAFAAANRDGRPLEPMFVYMFACVTAAGWVFHGFLILFPLETLRLLAGPQWDAAAQYVIFFAAAGIPICLAPLTQTVILATGRVDLASRADIITSLLRVALVMTTAILSRDLVAVALAYCASLVLSVPIFLLFKHRAIRNDWTNLAVQAARSLAVTIGTLLAPTLISVGAGLSRSQPLSMPLFLSVIALTAVTWLLMLRICKHPLASDPLYIRLLSRLRLGPQQL